MCDYAAGWEQHQKDILDVNEDGMLTLSGLVLILTRGGVPIDRNRII